VKTQVVGTRSRKFVVFPVTWTMPAVSARQTSSERVIAMPNRPRRIASIAQARTWPRAVLKRIQRIITISA